MKWIVCQKRAFLRVFFGEKFGICLKISYLCNVK